MADEHIHPEQVHEWLQGRGKKELDEPAERIFDVGEAEGETKRRPVLLAPFTSPRRVAISMR